MSGALTIRPPQTLAAVVAKVHNAERVAAVARALDQAVLTDPTLRAVAHTARITGWSPGETAAYMILCLKARTERAEALYAQERNRNAAQQVWIGVDMGVQT